MIPGALDPIRSYLRQRARRLHWLQTHDRHVFTRVRRVLGDFSRVFVYFRSNSLPVPPHWMAASAPSVCWPASMHLAKSPSGSRWYAPLTGNSTGLDWGGGGGSGGLLVSSVKPQLLTEWLYLAMAAARSSWGTSGCSGT